MESYWPGLFAKALEGVNVKELITNIGSGVGAAPAAGGMFLFILSIVYVQWYLLGSYDLFLVQLILA